MRNWGEEGFELRDVSLSTFDSNEVHNNCEDGFDLDDEVLLNIYRENALRIITK